MKHACPIPGCTARIHDDLLMCCTHWMLTPGTLRRNVNQAWRALQRARRLTPQEFLGARKTYLVASNEAVATVARAELPVCD